MKRADFEVAVAAGLVVVFPLYKVFTLPGTCDSPNPLSPGEAVGLLVALASYLSVPLLFELIPGQRDARFVWVWTPVLGSLPIEVVLYCLRARPVDWGLDRSAKVWLLLCLWTLPFAAIVYCFGMIIRGGRHEGPKENLSIWRS